MRDDFSQSVKDILAKRVGYRCSNPSCRCLTSGPQEHPDKSINVGVASHITSASPEGPRYDNTLTSEERQSTENGIWLCQKCGKLIDSDLRRYSLKKLHGWKKRAEQKALSEVESGSKQTNSKIETLKNALKLLGTQKKIAIGLLKERHGDDFSQELSPRFKGTSKEPWLSGMAWPLYDGEVKDWYFGTIAILENTSGHNKDCFNRMKKLRKELLFDNPHGDNEFNTSDTGELLKHSINLLEDCIRLLEKKIEIHKKIVTR
jgi:hypothetical protein